MSAIITCRNNGPLRIEGDFVLKDQNGAVFDLSGRAAISLCRCGESNDKPFCDGAHKNCEFDSLIVARTMAPPAPKTGAAAAAPPGPPSTLAPPPG